MLKTECIQIRGPEEIIKEQQKQAGEQEKLEWKLRGANEVGDIWRTPQGQVVVTEQLEQMDLSQAHGAGHNNRMEIIDTIIKQNNMWFPRMQEKVNEFLTRCSECMTRNTFKSAPHPIRHFPSPQGPFTHLVMDFVDMIKPIKGKRYMLVVVDRFSRWVEAFPVGKQSGEAVA